MRALNQFICGLLKGAKNFSNNITIIVNTALLSIVYILGVGFASIFAKIVGKKFLELKTSRKSKSYWNDLNIGDEKEDTYYRQF